MHIRELVQRVALRTLLYPHRLLPRALARNRDRQPFEAGTSYGELLARCRRLAGLFRSHGLEPGDRVLVDLVNSAEFMEIRLAAILAGMVAVPIPPGTDDNRLGWLAEFTEAGFYVGPRTNRLPGLAGLPVSPGERDLEEYELRLQRAPSMGRTPLLQANHLLAINFTSGTTGEPKGVMSNVSAWGFSLYYALLENRVPLSPSEVFLHAIPLATAGSTLILPAVLSGARNVFLSQWDAEHAAQLVERERITRMFLTPTMLAEFLDVVRHGGADVSSLKNIIYGTEGIPVARIRKALDVFGPILQQGYGMAEALPPLCLLHAEEHARALRNPENSDLLSSTGRPTRAVDLTICEADGSPVARGQPGSIRIRGKTLSPGYWRNPELTGTTRKNGYYISGDLGFLDPRGYLHVLGREDAIPTNLAKGILEKAEADDRVMLAWVREDPESITLHVVPARDQKMRPEDLHPMVDVPGTEDKMTQVQIHEKIPFTPSYKLNTVQARSC